MTNYLTLDSRTNVKDIEHDEDFTRQDWSDVDDDLPVKRVNFDSGENTIENYNQTTSDDGSDEDDFIDAFNESEDRFDEAIRQPTKEPLKSFNLHRTASRAAPGTVKKLMARFQNPQ